MSNDTTSDAQRAASCYRTIMAGSTPLDADQSAAASDLAALCVENIAQLEVSERHCQYWLEQVRALRLQQTKNHLRTLDEIRERLQPLNGGE